MEEDALLTAAWKTMNDFMEERSHQFCSFSTLQPPEKARVASCKKCQQTIRLTVESETSFRVEGSALKGPCGA